MSTVFFEKEAYDALAEKLLSFTFPDQFQIRWGMENLIPMFGTTYIDVDVFNANKRTQDMGGGITSRLEGQLKLRLSTPETHGEAYLIELADQLTEFFFPNGQPTAYSFGSATDKQAAHVISTPKFEGDIKSDGGFYKGTLLVTYMLQPQRNI